MGASQVQSKKNPLVVRTDRMAAHSIAERMADMRTWLDRNKVELAAFRPITIHGGVAFDAQIPQYRAGRPLSRRVRRLLPLAAA